MGNPNEFDCELLSAYLDDALDGQDRSRAEELLATNPGASRYFNQLRSASQCLRSVPSAKLRSSLTARVLEQARVQALADGLPKDHHVLRAQPSSGNAVTRSDPLTDPPAMAIPMAALDRATSAAFSSAARSASSGGQGETPPAYAGGQVIPSSVDRNSSRGNWLPRSNRLLWSAVTVAAATIVALAVVPLTLVDQPQNGVAELVPPETTQGHLANGAEETSPFDSVAVNDPSSVAETDQTEAIGSAEPALGSDSVAHVMQGSGALDRLKDDLAPQVPAFDFLMVIDSVVATEAWESGRFERLLEELGIPITSPIVADEDLFQALEETRVIVGSAGADAAGQQPRAALVFLRADGATLDRLHQAMHSDPASFPQVVTDLSIDEHSAALHKLLRGQAAADSQRGPSARVLSASVGGGSDVVPNFVPVERRKMVSSERAPALSVPGLSGFNLGNQSPRAEVLVILREPSPQ